MSKTPTLPQSVEGAAQITNRSRERRQLARDIGSRGEVVVITGAVGGIGRATALRFAEEGARIAARDVSDQSAAQLESAIQAAGGEGVFQEVDVTSASAVEAAVAVVIERWGRIDVLVNNAGIVRDAQLVKWSDGRVQSVMSDEMWDSVIGVNLKAVFLCTRATVPHMIAAGGGVVLCASSVVGILGNFGKPIMWLPKQELSE